MIARSSNRIFQAVLSPCENGTCSAARILAHLFEPLRCLSGGAALARGRRVDPHPRERRGHVKPARSGSQEGCKSNLKCTTSADANTNQGGVLSDRNWLHCPRAAILGPSMARTGRACRWVEPDDQNGSKAALGGAHERAPRQASASAASRIPA